MVEFAVSPDGKLGSETSRDGKDGIVREMEIGVLMSATAAKNLAEFLLNHVKLLQESEPEKRDDSVSSEKE